MHFFLKKKAEIKVDPFQFRTLVESYRHVQSWLYTHPLTLKENMTYYKV